MWTDPEIEALRVAWEEFCRVHEIDLLVADRVQWKARAAFMDGWKGHEKWAAS